MSKPAFCSGCLILIAISKKLGYLFGKPLLLRSDHFGSPFSPVLETALEPFPRRLATSILLP